MIGLLFGVSDFGLLLFGVKDDRTSRKRQRKSCRKSVEVKM